MELKKDALIFINVVCRVLLLVAFLSEDEASDSKVRNSILNWNYALTDRVVLILVNGLRDDFLDQDSTPFLKDLACREGSFSKARVGSLQSMESGLKLLLTGVPAQSSLFFWNRPDKYRTVLDYVTCKCVIGRLPLQKPPIRSYFGVVQSEVIGQFRLIFGEEESKECLYVVSFDFADFSEAEYKERLEKLDEDLRALAEDVAYKWRDFRKTFVLTSGRGWSLWNRTEENVDVPVIVWGDGILPRKREQALRVPDVTALISTLLGQSFPAGSLGHIPTYLLNVTGEAKYNMMFYNMEHLQKTVGDYDDDVFLRGLRDFIEDEDTMSLHLSTTRFLRNVEELRFRRMRLVSGAILLSFLFWGMAFLVVLTRGTFTLAFSPSMLLLTGIGLTVVVVYLPQAKVPFVLSGILLSIVVQIYPDIIRAFCAEGYRAFVVSALASVFIAFSSLVGREVFTTAVIIPVLLLPFYKKLVNRMNRKVLSVWIVSSIALASFCYVPVIGRSPSPGLTSSGALTHVIFFRLVYHAFRRKFDAQCWIMTVAVLLSFFYICFANDSQNGSPFFIVSWCFLSFTLAAVFFLRGTLLEHLLKFHFLLLVPYELLSLRHETFFYSTLSALMLAWLFIENVPGEKNLVLYTPSVFSVEKPGEFLPVKIGMKHYRQVFLFLILCFVSFFAAGNLPTLYSYDLSIGKPFGDLYPSLLVILKFLIPYTSIVFSFITLSLIQKRDPSTCFILSICISDAFASCLLIFVHFLRNVFDFTKTHYIVLQMVQLSVTVLYLIEKNFLL